MSKSIKSAVSKQGTESYKSRSEGGMSFTNYINLKELQIERFKDGDNTDYVLDILPYEVLTNNHPNRKKGDMTYNMDIWVHKKVGADKGNYLCMKKTFNQPCKICEEFLKLQGEGHEFEDIKHLYPSRRIIYNVLHKNKVMIADMSFKIFEELWLAAREKLLKKGKDIFPIYTDESGCTSLEFSTTDKNGIGRYIQFDFPEIEDFNEKFLEKVVSLEKLLVIPDQEKILRSLHAEVEECEINSNEEEEEEEEEEENEEQEEQEKNEKYIEEIEKKQKKEKEDEDEEPVRKKKKVEECPYELVFGKDWDGYNTCDKCLNKNKEIYDKCEEKFNEMKKSKE